MSQNGMSFDSPEKQMIREKLWDVAFIDLINKEKIAESEIKYFCLPGPECIYLKQILTKFKIKKTNIYTAEQYEDYTIPIRTILNGQGKVISDTIENICQSGCLNYAFPFDIVDLDFCGQAFVFSGTEYQRRWDVIKYFIKCNNSHKKKVFYLLLTVLGGRSNTEGKRFLLKQIEKLNEISGLKKDANDWKEDKLIQEALPSIIIEEALDHDYKVEKYDSYRYRQSGHKSNMVAFSFKLTMIEKGLGNSITQKAKLVRDTVEIYYSSEPKKLEI